MGKHKYYYFDDEECQFIPVEYNLIERIIFNVSLWLLCGIVLGGSGIALLSSEAGPPSEIALRAENNELMKQLEQTRKKISTLNNKVASLEQTDNTLLRSVLGMDKLPPSERQGGTGGSDIYAKSNVYNQKTAELIEWTKNNLDNIERRLNIQKTSFKEIKRYYNKNKKRMMHIPAIKPIDDIMLSGYGMRYHPVLGYKRMHEGLDFRANIGTPVHATGDGVIKFASRKGTYGRLLVIDHGFGLETYYAHLSSFKKGIEPGVEVERGETIAYTGNSGVTKGPHLHYEVHKNSNTIDPLNYLFADISPEEFALYQRISKNNPTSMD